MDDEPKVKRRPAWRHAVSGLALLVFTGLGVWLLEQAEWTELD
jgi:cytochrome oxidase assembly protein ShyY1